MIRTRCSVLMRCPVLVVLYGLFAWSAEASVQFLARTEADGAEFQEIVDEARHELGVLMLPAVDDDSQEATGVAVVYPGQPSGVWFPEGTDATLGVTLQSNSGGESPDIPASGSTLLLMGPNEDAGYPFTRISPDVLDDSIDMILEPPGFNGLVRAASFAVRCDEGSNIVVRLYDSTSLIDSFTFDPGTRRVGFITDSPGLMRVNVSAPHGYVEVGELALYTLAGPPDAEASTVVLLTPGNVFAGDAAVILMNVTDDLGRLREAGGDVVRFHEDAGVLSDPVDLRNGSYVVEFRHTVPERVRVDAYLEDLQGVEQWVGSVEIDVVAGRAARIREFAAASEVIDFAGGQTAVWADVEDAFGNWPEGVRVLFESSDPMIGTISAEGLTDASGMATGLVISAESGSGSFVVSARIVESDANVASNHVRSVPMRVSNPARLEAVVEGWVVVDRPYDGTMSVPVVGEANLLGVLPEDEVDLEGEPVFSYEQAGVGSNLRVWIEGVSLAGPDAEKYDLVLPLLRGSILPATLSVTGAVARSRNFDGSMAAEIEGGSLFGVLPGEDVRLLNASTGTFVQATVGSHIAVTTYMALGGADAGNYVLEQPELFADIFDSETIFVQSPEPSGAEFEVIEEANLYFIGKQSIPVPASGGDEVMAVASVFPGVTAMPFESGTDEALRITLRSNARGPDAASYEEGAVLMVIGPDSPGGFARIGTSDRTDSFDLLIEPPLFGGLVQGVSMAAQAGNDSRIEMRLYDADGTLLDEHSFAPGARRLGMLTRHVGLLRLNVFAPDGFMELGEIRIYSHAGPPDAAVSTLVASPRDSVFGDLASELIVTVTDEDGRIRKAGGDLVTLSHSAGVLSELVDRRDGTYRAELRRLTPGAVTVTAQLVEVDGTRFLGAETITFIEARASTVSDVEVDAEVIDLNGGTTELRAFVQDVYGRARSGIRVTFESDHVNRATVPHEMFTDAEGVATVWVTGGHEVGDVTITASIHEEDTNVASNHSRSVSLRVRDPDWTLSIEGWVAHDRFYDRTTAAHVTGPTNLVGARVEHDVHLEGEAVFNFASKVVGANRLITVSGLNLVGEDAPLYTIDWPALRASILPAPLEVTGAVAQSKGFDGTTAAVVSGAQLSGVLAGDHVTLLNATTGTFAQAEIGTGLAVTTHMTLGGPDADNYALTQPVLFADIYYAAYQFFSSEVDAGGRSRNCWMQSCMIWAGSPCRRLLPVRRLYRIQ